MTSRTDKFPAAAANRQAGITLLLAVLVLSAITAIAFSVATIVLVEIRASGDVLRTEPVLYTVEGVTEEAFYGFKRFVPNTAATNNFDIINCLPASLSLCALNSVTASNASYKYDAAPRLDVIPAGVTKTYLFVNPDAPNDFAKAYNSFGFNQLNNGGNSAPNVKVQHYNTDGTVTIDRASSPISLNGSFSYTVPNTSGQYEMSIYNPAPAGGSSVLIQVDAFDVNGVEHIPLVGQQAMDITARYLGLTRKYTINIPSEGASAPSNAQNVTWTNAVGVTVTGNTITKSTGNNGWENAGAASVQKIMSGDGYVEWTASDANSIRMAGLGIGDSSQNYPDVDFGIYPHFSGAIYIYEGAAGGAGLVGPISGVTYKTGDKLRVAVTNNVITYMINGAVIYTSSVTPTYPLIMDSAIYSSTGVISNAVIAGDDVQ